MNGAGAHSFSIRSSLKAEMLCLGVVPSPDSYDLCREIDETFIHGTIFLLEGGGIVNTSVWHWAEEEDPVSRNIVCPPRLERDEVGQLFIQGQVGKCKVELLRLGDVAEATLRRRRLGDWFTLHNLKTVFCAPVRQCIFMTMEKPCHFCTFEGGRIDSLSASEFSDGLQSVRGNLPLVSAIAIGGGTPNLQDMGVAYFSKLVEIASSLGLATSVELVPPAAEEQLEPLVRAGVSALIMSLEVWGDSHRSAWCMGKGLIDRCHYERAWDWGIEHLGPGRVASVLLVGAEPLGQTLKGATELIRQGVIPTLIPLRWYPASRFTDWSPVAPMDYLELEREVSNLLRSAHLSPAQQPGCTGCGGCSLEAILETGRMDV